MPRSTKIRKFRYSRSIQTIVSIILVLSAVGYYYFRFIVNANMLEVVPGKVYRSGQPSEADLGKWADKYGFKTVINLRAKELKVIKKEELATEHLGMKLVPVYLSGSRLVSPEELSNLIEVLETAEIPVLIHCESGVDRAGFVSAVAALAIGHEGFDRAKQQAYVPPGPWKRQDFSNTRGDYIYDYAHVSDTLRLYENYCRQENVDKNDWQQFKKWAREMPASADLDAQYRPVFGYFPFLDSKKRFFPIYTLLKGAYVQFSIEILVVVLLIWYTKFCLKAAKHS
ncbi:MAG: tyrosine-protein phosphatase [Sedimentisphaerales bacterium]